jgi:hypothetical protein
VLVGVVEDLEQEVGRADDHAPHVGATIIAETGTGTKPAVACLFADLP